MVMDTVASKLQSRFGQLVEALGGSETTVTKWTKEFTSRYTESQRHYHTLDHIHAMLECLDKSRSLVKDETSLSLAVFFHDWIYDPKSKDNELDSIKCFKDFASDVELSDLLSSRVAEYIERTITHTLPTTDGQEVDTDLNLFLDFDLEVLSRDNEQYATYSEQIRAEYSHVKPIDYYAGRTKVLKTLLGRDRLYFSDIFYQSREQKARANLEKEIVDLQDALRSAPPS